MFVAHLQAVFIPIFLGLKSINRFKQVRFPHLLPFAFISLGFASMFEMIDHTSTNWIYVDHISIFNWLFYCNLSLGLSIFTMSVESKKSKICTNIILIFSVIFSYWILGKASTVILQIIISILLLTKWWNRFKDLLIFIYPITGVILTTSFGILLSSTGEQIWHVFIGPSGTISVLSFYLILKRSKNK